MPPILETRRLVFHTFTPDDLDLLRDLHSDPEVQRYLGETWSAAEAKARLDYYLNLQVELGFSKWKAYLRDGTFVGRAGVSRMRETGEFEVGYILARHAWGQGLASEAAQGIVEWMFANTAVPDLIGFARVENLASRRVLEKLGMAYEREEIWDGNLWAYYRLKRP